MIALSTQAMAVIWYCMNQILGNSFELELFICITFFYQLHSWQPGIKNPYRGLVMWQVPESLDITVTLFKVWSMNNLDYKREMHNSVINMGGQ